MHAYLHNVTSQWLLLENVARHADAFTHGSDVCALWVAVVVEINGRGGEGVPGAQACAAVYLCMYVCTLGAQPLAVKPLGAQ
eukprot:scaffold226392_cov25-Tisochrysis_lutea.AAC.2